MTDPFYHKGHGARRRGYFPLRAQRLRGEKPWRQIFLHQGLSLMTRSYGGQADDHGYRSGSFTTEIAEVAEEARKDVFLCALSVLRGERPWRQI
jgi:hypothetical protein